MQKEFPIADDAQRKLEDDARRYNQLVTHPRDAHHLFALLLAHQRTSVGGVQFLNGILDQLHIQDMVKAAQLDTNRSWQAGAADGRTGTEIAADKMIAANMQIIDAQRAARATARMFDVPIRDPRVVAAMQVDTAPLRAGVPLVDADLGDLELRTIAKGTTLTGENQLAAAQDYAKEVQTALFQKGAGDA